MHYPERILDANEGSRARRRRQSILRAETPILRRSAPPAQVRSCAGARLCDPAHEDSPSGQRPAPSPGMFSHRARESGERWTVRCREPGAVEMGDILDELHGVTPRIEGKPNPEGQRLRSRLKSRRNQIRERLRRKGLL